VRPEDGVRAEPASAARGNQARFVAVASGKGGVGKTNIATNVAVAAAGLGQRVLLVDGDLGLANVDVLLGLVAERNVADVIANRCSVDDAVVEGPRGVRILTAASGRWDLAALDGIKMEALLQKIRRASTAFDLVVIDAGAGVGPSVVSLAAACSPILVATTAEPTALADAYGTLKVLDRAAPGRPLEIVVSGVTGELEARTPYRHLSRVARRFLQRELRFRGYIPLDPRLVEAVALQRAVVEAYPSADSSRHLIKLAADLVRDTGASRVEGNA
jgi:flagellar biosynthesis protein FlhG